MASQEKNNTVNAAGNNTKPAELQSLDQQLESFIQFGGFDLLEGSIDGVQNLNPERKARKNIFLTESSKKAERDTLKKTLKLWIEALGYADNLVDLVNVSVEKADESEKVLKKNLAIAVEESRELEQNYRTNLYFIKILKKPSLKIYL